MPAESLYMLMRVLVYKKAACFFKYRRRFPVTLQDIQDISFNQGDLVFPFFVIDCHGKMAEVIGTIKVNDDDDGLMPEEIELVIMCQFKRNLLHIAVKIIMFVFFYGAKKIT